MLFGRMDVGRVDQLVMYVLGFRFLFEFGLRIKFRFH